MNVLDRQNSIEHLLPNEIEKRSFEIISKELKERGIELPKEEEMVTKRVIHTSADFEYTKTLVYSKHAVRIAKERGTTRAAVSMEMATKLKKPLIFTIGNAPTALIQLYEMLKDQRFRPEFIIGVPVGFVNVEAAKELILETEVPHIVNRGRKGGSNVAAAICNAILYELKKEQSGV